MSMCEKGLLSASLLMAGAVLMAPGESRAAGSLGVTITITGDVVIPPCTVNNSQALEVNFGDIPVPDIGDAFRQVKTVPVNCPYVQGTPYVKVSGPVMTGAAGHVLETTVARFGIALYQGNGVGTPMLLGGGTGNIGYRITSGLSTPGANGSFTFTAVPYRPAGGADPEAKAFEATASMSITYL